MSRWLTVIVYCLLLSAALLTGCREKVAQSDLDQFQAWADELEPGARQDTLQALAGGDTRVAAFANYYLANRAYQAATDSAYARGWNYPAAAALLDSAENRLHAAVALDSSFVEALVNLGSVYDDRAEQLAVREVRDERFQLAEKYYLMALEIDPDDSKARCNLGSLYLRQKRAEQALAEYQKVLDQDPTDPLAHYNLAIMFAEAKIFKEAIREWELAAKYDPDGDIGQRSRDNVKIVEDLLNAPDPAALK